MANCRYSKIWILQFIGFIHIPPSESTIYKFYKKCNFFKKIYNPVSFFSFDTI